VQIQYIGNSPQVSLEDNSDSKKTGKAPIAKEQTPREIAH